MPVYSRYDITKMQSDTRTRVIIMGVAGRDFHNFNIVFRNDPLTRVVAFTAAQIPDIAGRMTEFATAFLQINPTRTKPTRINLTKVPTCA
jgi:hypothetical protein